MHEHDKLKGQLDLMKLHFSSLAPKAVQMFETDYNQWVDDMEQDKGSKSEFASRSDVSDKKKKGEPSGRSRVKTAASVASLEVFANEPTRYF